MFGRDRCPGGALPETVGTVSGGPTGTRRAERATALGRCLCEGLTAQWGAEVDRTSGGAGAGWQCASDAAVRGTKSLVLEADLGVAREADDCGTGTGLGLGGG